MTTIYELNQHKEMLQESVMLGEAATRLAMNPDFQLLIMKEFCVNEAARYVQASCDPALPKDSRDDSLALAQASGHLKRWLSVTLQMGNRAKQDIKEIEEQLLELRTEEV